MIQSYFLNILKSALKGDSQTLLTVTKEDAKEILKLAKIHKVLPLIYDCMKRSGFAFEASTDTYLQKKVKLMVVNQALRTEAFCEIYSAFNAMELTPVVVKGIVSRSLYPKPDCRISADEDLLIPAHAYKEYRQALISLGFSPLNEAEDSYQTSFLRNDGIHIELHTSLFHSNQSYFESWNKLFADAPSRTIQEKISNTKIRTLCHTDHLLYLILHALKHFIHSGVGIRQICDILLFSQKYCADINWDYVLSKCEELCALNFFLGILAIGERHLNIHIETDCAVHHTLPDESALLADILCAGIYGDSTMSRKHSGFITFSTAKTGKKVCLLRKVFPCAKVMAHDYPYTKRNPVLLPVAWSSRLLKYMKEVRKSENNSPIETVNIASRRLAIMKEYGIIPKKQTQE